MHEKDWNPPICVFTLITPNPSVRSSWKRSGDVEALTLDSAFRYPWRSVYWTVGPKKWNLDLVCSPGLQPSNHECFDGINFHNAIDCLVWSSLFFLEVLNAVARFRHMGHVSNCDCNRTDKCSCNHHQLILNSIVGRRVRAKLWFMMWIPTACIADSLGPGMGRQIGWALVMDPQSIQNLCEWHCQGEISSDIILIHCQDKWEPAIEGSAMVGLACQCRGIFWWGIGMESYDTNIEDAPRRDTDENEFSPPVLGVMSFNDKQW